MGIIADAIGWWLGHINAATIQTEIVDPVNTAIDGLGAGFLGENISGSVPVLTTTGVYYAGAAVTFVLTETRRVRINGQGAVITSSGAPAHYDLRVAYTPGSSPGTQTVVGFTANVSNAATAVAGCNSTSVEGTVLLTAGTYTAFITAARLTGGSSSDTLAGASYVAVYDVGAA